MTSSLLASWEEQGGRPSLFTALERQLGLKLDSRRIPVNYFVIDHLEKPSEN
jgi:uncharacterized protein (TIGR03435 family)